MKLLNTVLFSASVLTASISAQEAYTIDDYNSNNLKHGVVFNWEYKPTFYTGFAPRIEEPSRIYTKASRGNITRVTTILDKRSVLTYLFSLKKRYEVFNKLVDDGYIKEYHLNQREMFSKIIESEAYQILPTIEAFEAERISEGEFYTKSLWVIKKLNPERVRLLLFNLGDKFSSFRKQTLAKFSTIDPEKIQAKIISEKEQTLIDLNRILPGRIDLEFASEKVVEAYTDLVQKILNNTDEIKNYESLFSLISQNKYNFNIYTLGTNKETSALKCQSMTNCTLNYAEFTSIYPMGTVEEYVNDGEGNKVPKIQTPGAMSFHGRGHYDVDQIRGKTYYAWIPKMNYDRLGNGYHNPAVSSRIGTKISLAEGAEAGAIKTVKELLNVPDEKGLVRLHVVARGGVSSGCNRLAAGHMWELRNIFPSSPERMVKVKYRGSNSKDYDLFDIDGDGTLEVMGVKYYIAYSLAKAGAATIFKDPITGKAEVPKRNAGAYTGQSFNRVRFLSHLFGANQIKLDPATQVIRLVDPSFSMFGAKRINAKDRYSGTRYFVDSPFSVSLEGEYKLYEQTYESDKLQFYKMTNRSMFKDLKLEKGSDHTNQGKFFVRTLGRIVGCGPYVDEYCWESTFDQQLRTSLGYVK